MIRSKASSQDRISTYSPRIEQPRDCCGCRPRLAARPSTGTATCFANGKVAATAIIANSKRSCHRVTARTGIGWIQTFPARLISGRIGFLAAAAAAIADYFLELKLVDCHLFSYVFTDAKYTILVRNQRRGLVGT